MPKLKTRKGAAKRVKITATGLLTRRKAMRSHNFAKKSTSNKRMMIKNITVAVGGDEKRLKKMLGL